MLRSKGLHLETARAAHLERIALRCEKFRLHLHFESKFSLILHGRR
eukprot:UN16489